MIYIDPREGSKEILDYVNAIPGHPQTEHLNMDYGDVVFSGNGPDGPMLVGLEVKKIGDVLNCIDTGRFTGHQVGGLKSAYEVVYLVVVGEHRAAWTSGFLQMKLEKDKKEFWWTVKTGNRTWTHYEFMAWLTMVEIGWGVRTRMVRDMKELARMIVSMYTVLQKPWEGHKTLQPFYLGPPGVTEFVRPGLVERVVAQVDGIGPSKAREIGKRFTSVADMLSANPVSSIQPTPEVVAYTVKRWKGIPGVGKSTAERIIRQFWEGEQQK